jgi:hypothetical protein
VTAIGVFCARVRVEEKQLIETIGAAGFVAVPVPPASVPLPPGPASSGGSMLGDLLGAAVNGQHGKIEAVIDRAANRSVAAATLSLLRAAGIATFDAGIAATGTRLDVAAALTAAGLARPTSLVGFSEETSIAAANRLGFPAVMCSVVHVVGGRAIAYDGARPGFRTISIAETAAEILGASLVSVEVAMTHEGLVVWDVKPVAEFRHAQQLGELSVAEAVARAVTLRLPATPAVALAGEVPHGYALSA